MTDEFYNKLQEQVGEWSDENFGDQSSTLPTLGLGEELGETAFETEEGSREAIMDGIGDTIIYFADVCHRRNLQLGEWRDYIPTDMPFWDNHWKELLYAKGKFQHSVLKDAQGIRQEDDTTGFPAEMEALAMFMVYLERLANHYHMNLYHCVEFAWGEVSEREWDAEINEDD